METTIKDLNIINMYKQHYDKSFSMNYHAHPSIEIMYIKRGKATVKFKNRDDDTSEDIFPNSFIIINSAVKHKLLISESCEIYNLEFLYNRIIAGKDPIINDFILHCLEFKDCKITQSFFLPYFNYLVLDDTRNIYTTIVNLQYEMNSNATSNDSNVLTNLYKQELFLNMSRCCTRSQNHPANIFVNKTISYLEKNFKKQIRISELADYCNISQAYLQRSFKLATNKSLILYLNELRINKSKFLLCFSDLSINEIAICVGFLNRQTYCLNFLNFCSVSPSTYRKEHTDEDFELRGNYFQTRDEK